MGKSVLGKGLAGVSAPLKTWLSFCLTVALAALLALGMARVARAEGEPAGNLEPEAQEVARRINQIRAQAGLPPLILHPLLSQAAAAHIQDMIASGRYGHLGSDGSRVGQRVARTGYVLDGWAGEIWAAYRTLDETFRFWMTDPPHRQSILNPHYREMGVAAFPRPQGQGLIVVVDFATGSRGTAAPRNLPQPQPASVTSPPAVQPTDPMTGQSYTVQPGDTLFSLGLRFRVPWEAIAEVNGLTERSLLQVGQTLRIPLGQEPVTAPDQTEPAAYTVQPGDTLAGIAARFGLSWQALARVNGLNEASILQIGQVLEIPGREKATERTHRVQPGETVVGIAYRYGVDWRELLAVNHLSPSDLLQVGQTLRIPQAGP